MFSSTCPELCAEAICKTRWRFCRGLGLQSVVLGDLGITDAEKCRLISIHREMPSANMLTENGAKDWRSLKKNVLENCSCSGCVEE